MDVDVVFFSSCGETLAQPLDWRSSRSHRRCVVERFQSDRQIADSGYSSYHDFYCDFFRKIRQMGHPALANASRVKIRGGLLVLKDDKLIANFENGYHTTLYYDERKRILGAHRTREGARNIHEDKVEYDIGRLLPEDFQMVHRM